MADLQSPSSGRQLTTQMRMHTQCVPRVLQLVGDKAGRVYLEAVQEYLTHSWLKWDAGLLASMFQEADYAGNGFLTAKDLSATLSGRYPKRQHTADWRALVAGLMGVEQLILLEVDREPISEAELRQHRKQAVTSYAAWLDVEDLPVIAPGSRHHSHRPTSASSGGSRPWSGRSSKGACSRPASGRSTSAGVAPIPPPPQQHQPAWAGPQQSLLTALDARPGTAAAGGAAAGCAVAAPARRPASAAPGGGQRGIDQQDCSSSLSAWHPGGVDPRSAALMAAWQQQFIAFRPPPPPPAREQPQLSSSLLRKTRPVSASALTTLRDNIESAAHVLPEFRNKFRPLKTADTDRRLCIGKQLDLSISCARWP